MQRIPCIYFAESPAHGRGIFTSEDIEEGSLLEICPVIHIPHDQVKIIHGTVLHDYYYLWGEEQEEAVIVLGYGSVYNHAITPNAYYVIDYKNKTMDFLSLRDIKAGEEITINYNGEFGNADPVWFQIK